MTRRLRPPGPRAAGAALARRRRLGAGLGLVLALGAGAPASAGLYRYELPSAQTGHWVFDGQGATVPGIVLVPPPTLGAGIASPSAIGNLGEGRLTLTFPAETTIHTAVVLYDRFVGPNAWAVASHVTTEAGLGPLNSGPTGGYQALIVQDGQPAGQRQVLVRALSFGDQSVFPAGVTSTNPTALTAILREDAAPAFTALAAPAAAAPLEAPALPVSWALDDATSGPAAVDAIVIGVGGQRLHTPPVVDTTLMTGQASGGQRARAGSAAIALPDRPGSYTIVLRGYDVAGNATQSAPIAVRYVPPPGTAADTAPRPPAAAPPPPLPPPPVLVPAPGAPASAISLTRLGANRRPGSRPALGVVYGARFVLAGRVRSAGAPAARQRVALYDATGKLVARAATTARGGFRLRVTALRSGLYRVRSGVGRRSERSLRLVVVPRIVTRARVTATLGASIVLRARVTPGRAHAGRVVLVRYRRHAGEDWEAFGRATRVGRRGQITFRYPAIGRRAFGFPAQLFLPAAPGRPAAASRTLLVSVSGRR